MRLAASGHRAMWSASGTTFECKKNSPSIDCRTSGSISAADGFPRLHLLVTRTPSGNRPAKASPTTSSALPSP